MSQYSPAAILYDADGTPVKFGIEVSTNNTTTTPLGPSGSFIGPADNLTKFHEIDVTIARAPSNASGTFYFEFSPNGTHWDVSVPLTVSESTITPLSLRIVLPYFRVRYINGEVAQTEFRLTTVYHRQASKSLTRFLDQRMDYNEPIENTRAVITTLCEDGYFRNLSSYRGHADVDDEFLLGVSLRKSTESGSLPLGTNTAPLITFPAPFNTTTFGESRVANPYTIVDLVNKYDLSSLEYSTQTVNSGSVVHIPDQSGIRLSVTTANGSSAKLRTNAFYRYQAGKSIRLRFSLYCADSGNSNQIKRWGFYDDNDGLFYELNGSDFRLIRRTSTSGSPVDNVILRSNWNGDKLDGSGLSSLNLDLSKANIFEIQLQWFGVGIVRFFINGILVHELDNQNILTAPYMKTAQLPLSWEIMNTDASSSSSITYICGSVTIEGGQQPPHYTFGAFNNSDRTVTDVAELPLLSIKLKDLFNSITNRMTIQPFLAIISCFAGRAGYRIVFDGALTDPNWTSADSDSGVEFDTSATALTGGHTILRGFLPSSNDNVQINLLELFQNNERGLKLDAFATSSNILTIAAINEGSGTNLMRASITWKEIR